MRNLAHLLNRPPLIGGPYRRTDAETLALYCWASAKHRARPDRVRLAELAAYPGLGNERPLYARVAREALAGRCEVAVARALVQVQQEVDRLSANRRRLHDKLPLLARFLP